LQLPDIQLEVNDEYVAGYLSMYPKQGLTPYKNIYAVPPAHFVAARTGKKGSQRFWGLDPTKEIRYRTDHEYEEHFLSLFSEAVRARLRVDAPVWADLSGGLDSSSIVCLADEILKKEPVQASDLETVSAVFDESSTSDERRFIRLVEEKRGRNGRHFTESEHPLITGSNFGDFRSIPNPIELFAQYHIAVRKQMCDRGSRVLLSGIGGDELLTASLDPSPELADLLINLKLSELNRRLQTWSLALKKPYLEVLIKHSVIPSLPRRLRGLYKRRQRAKQISLLEPGFIKSFGLPDVLLGPKDIFGFRLPSSRGQSTAFLSVTDVISPGHLLVWGPIEISYPFTHRPLVEFLQAIPPTQWIRPGETRSLMRRSLRAYLPAQIAKRKGKGNPTEALLRALNREWPRLRELLRDARVCAAGYVNPATLKTLIEEPDFVRNSENLAVIRICYLELWLRDLERRSRTIHTATVEISARSNQPERAMHAYS
jgi:asparagine synthase (glutamine-hydrolysing)